MIDHVYTVFITNKLKETIIFYERYLKFTKVFESTFFVLLQSPGEHGFYVGFMDETHPTSPPTPKAYNGNGSFLTIQVSDSKAFYEEVKRLGGKLAYELNEEPWGQRRFALVDPNNLWIDVVEQIEPKEGFWDKYIK